MSLQFDLFGDPYNRTLDASSYSAFEKSLRDSGCTRCALSGGRTNIVVDRGNPAAGIMAVGEGPGELEDIQGKAFVGRAGQLMDRLLAEEGIDTNRDFLIANVVKCRPPQNRAPQREEAEACLPFLKKQIELVRPHTILLLGAVAVRHLFRDRRPFSMKDEAGNVFTAPEHPGIEFMILYHPAYLLRDPRKQPDFMGHVRKLRRNLEPSGRWPGKQGPGSLPHS